jgi:beta-lactamase class A
MSLATLVASVALAAPLCALAGQAPRPTAADPDLPKLERELARLARLSPGVVGAGVMHVPSGRAVYFNRHERFPMLSTYKVPIAVQLLRLVDQKRLRLDTLLAVSSGDFVGGGTLSSDLVNDPGVMLSLRNVMELMLLISDNTATDVALRAAGGPAAVNTMVQAQVGPGMRVDRLVKNMIGDHYGLKNLPADFNLAGNFDSLFAKITPAERVAFEEAFNDDPLDTTTPEAMTLFFTKVVRGELLSPASTALLLDIMSRAQTGRARIPGYLPADTRVSQKTGTFTAGSTTGNVGVVQLPDGKGDLVIALYIKRDNRHIAQREAVMANIARAAYDYFIYNTDSR